MDNISDSEKVNMPSEGTRWKFGYKNSYDIKCSTISGKLPNDSSSIQHNQSNENAKKLPFLGQRHLVALWGFVFTSLIHIHRTSMGVAMVSMVNHTYIIESYTKNRSSVSCAVNSTTEDMSKTFKIEGEFSWNSQIQGNILGISFFSYIFGNLLAGRISEIWGVKRTIFLANFFTSLFVILTPFFAWWNLYALLVVQFARGLAQGFLIPPFYVAMANWFPRRERGMLSSFVMCGYTIGGLVGGILTGLLCDIPVMRWPSAFYILGGFNVILCILFSFFFDEMPQNHPHISKKEVNYIKNDQETVLTQSRPPIPWKPVFTSVKVFALIIGMFGYYWANTHFLVIHPTYMSTVLHYSMTQNGLASYLPFLAMTLSSVLWSLLCGWISKKDLLGVDKLRKCSNTISAVGYCLCLVGIVLAKCDRMINLICFTLMLFMTGIGLSGVMIVSGDMTPTYAGSLFGFTSAISSVASTMVPVVAGALTKQETLEEWHHVFYLHIAVVLGCALFFHVFGSAEVQPWNSQDPVKNSMKDSSTTRF